MSNNISTVRVQSKRFNRLIWQLKAYAFFVVAGVCLLLALVGFPGYAYHAFSTNNPQNLPYEHFIGDSVNAMIVLTIAGVAAAIASFKYFVYWKTA